MTREEAYYEWSELEDLILSWCRNGSGSAYCNAVRQRWNDLKNYLLHCGGGEKKNCDRKDWKCPPKTEEERMEWFFMNAFPILRKEGKDVLQEVMQRYGGKYPRRETWEEYKPHADLIRERYCKEHYPDSKPEDFD